MDSKLFYLPPDSRFAIMPVEMRSARHGLWLKQIGLAVCAVIFLGGLQMLPAEGHRDHKTSLHATEYSHSLAVTDPLIEESTEGREHEVRAQSYLVSMAAPFVQPEILFSHRLTVISPPLTSLTGCNTGSRAPPHVC